MVIPPAKPAIVAQNTPMAFSTGSIALITKNETTTIKAPAPKVPMFSAIWGSPPSLVRTKNVPMIDTIIVEVPNPSHPYGVRGVGETGIVPPIGTLANAIADATGVRMEELPMSPPNVLKAIKANKG